MPPLTGSPTLLSLTRSLLTPLVVALTLAVVVALVLVVLVRGTSRLGPAELTRKQPSALNPRDGLGPGRPGPLVRRRAPAGLCRARHRGGRQGGR